MHENCVIMLSHMFSSAFFRSVCQELTANFRGAKFKKFESKDDAWDFVKQFRYKSIKPTTEDSERKEDTQNNLSELVKLMDETAEPKCNTDNDSNDRFDFAAFSLRLSKLENTFQEKVMHILLSILLDLELL